RTETTAHPAGTCRMGSEAEAVGVPLRRVLGIDGLRVGDASVMPELPGGNTNAPTIMIAERMADLLRGHAPLRAARARIFGATAAPAAGSAGRRTPCAASRPRRR